MSPVCICQSWKFLKIFSSERALYLENICCVSDRTAYSFVHQKENVDHFVRSGLVLLWQVPVRQLWQVPALTLIRSMLRRAALNWTLLALPLKCQTVIIGATLSKLTLEPHARPEWVSVMPLMIFSESRESDWGRGVSGVMDGCCWKDWGAHQAVRLPHRSRTFRQNPMQSKTRRRRRTVFSSFLPSSESLHLVDLCGNARFKTSAFQHVSWIN